MIQTYLIINGALYLLFAIWCALKMSGSSRFLGYTELNNTGKVEYLTIYTGLQLGFSAYLLLSACNIDLHFAALLFCVCLYSGIIATRVISALFHKGLTRATYLVGGLEAVLTIWGWILLTNL